MLKYIIKRLAQSILILLGVSLIIYALIRCMPVDFVTQKLSSITTTGSEVSQEQIDKIVTPGESEKPTNATEKLVASQKESPVTTKEPAKTEEPESKISSAMKDKFSPKNGKTDGKNDSAGAGGTGAGVVGSINGRTFKGCALPSVKVNKPVTIYVSIVVDESGKVIDAQFKSDKGAGAGNQALRNACVKASYNARWSEKKGEPRAKGTLTWNLKPRS